MFDEMFFVGFLSRIKQCDRNRAERNTVSVAGKTTTTKKKQGEKKSAKKFAAILLFL